jgi:hypothetical protein
MRSALFVMLEAVMCACRGLAKVNTPTTTLKHGTHRLVAAVALKPHLMEYDLLDACLYEQLGALIAGKQRDIDALCCGDSGGSK